MAAFNQDGKVVNINDNVSITGKVVSLTGASSIAQITVQPLTGLATFVASGYDMQAVQNDDGVARSINGKAFGFLGDNVTVLGVVTSISGSGNQAILTVLLKTSLVSINVPAGSVRSVADVS